MMDLALTLQRIYDSEINVTITWPWDGGFQFALVSFAHWEVISREGWWMGPISLSCDSQLSY